MKLRKLNIKDAPFMLEWMHDIEVVKDLQTNFMQKTLEDCQHFIETSQADTSDLHLAVVDDMDTYMGTVSLKHIEDGSAEFAITVRRIAMGRGFSKYAMLEIIRRGLEELNLEQIYWCVAPENRRAVRFYDKNGYMRIGYEKLKIQGEYTLQQLQHYIWYCVNR